MTFEEAKLRGGSLFRSYRKIMENKLGRKLIIGEVVHHIDGNRQNNSPENLMLFSSMGAHRLFHAEKELAIRGYSWSQIEQQYKKDWYLENRKNILLKKLQKRIEQENGSIPCPNCNRKFNTKKSLSNHRRSYHVIV